MWVYAAGVWVRLCVCKIQLQDPSQSIASVERPAGAKHTLQPDEHPGTTTTAAAEATASQLVNTLDSEYLRTLEIAPHNPCLLDFC